MAMKFTEKQQQVIDTHGQNLLVAAAAGSGKTAVLVERIVQMISNEDNPVDIDRLLVVTFTNAAASEMRERIGKAIAKKLIKQPENEHLQRQTTLLHNAQITTIDSFCLFVIRNHFHTIGLDPGFRIAEEGEIKLLAQDVLAAVLEEAYDKAEPQFLQCAEYFSAGNRDSAIEEVILKLYDFAMSHPFPEQWLLDRKKDYETTGKSIERLPFMELLFAHTKKILQGCIRKLELAIRFCEEPDGPYFYAKLFEQEKDMLNRILCLPENYDDYCSAFETVVFDRLPGKKDDSVNAEKRERAKNLRDEVKKNLTNLKDDYFFANKSRLVMQMEQCNGAVCALVDLVLTYKSAFDAGKREKNLIDFNDVEHFALQILVKQGEQGACIPSETALEYRDYFEEILIDEYQDSNLVQEYLLASISGEADGRYNRFMVGDVKQSIYKFRLARPELFLEKYDTYAQGEHTCRIDLHRNFRSRYEILNSTNCIFDQLMGEEVGGIVYDDLAALHLGAEYPEKEKKDNATEVLLYETGDKPEELTIKEQEAYGVADRIKQLMRDFQVTERNGDQQYLRKVKYGDIVILLRSMSGWDEVFKRVLEEQQIPVYMEARTGYFAAEEVQELLNILRVIDNPLQDIPLFGVMKSCHGQFSEEEIASIRADMPEAVYLYDAVKHYAREKDLVQKIQRFLEKIVRWRDMAAYLPVQELLQMILRETDYLNYVTVKPDGSRRRANVEMLLNKAANYEKTSYFGLYQFLRYMEQLEKYEVDFGEAGIQDENADVVRIMSIHKSKGLEFPVCFVSGLAKGFQTKDITTTLIADVDVGVGVDYVNSALRIKSKSLRKNVIANKIRVDNLAEELRILYVALTRAREKLILTATIKDRDKCAKKLQGYRDIRTVVMPYDSLLSAGSYLDFILMALSRNHCADVLLAPEKATESIKHCNQELYTRDMSVHISLLNWQDKVEEEIDDILIKGERKKTILDPQRRSKRVGNREQVDSLVEQRLAYQYPYEKLRDLYTKTTVSELKKAAMEEPEEVSFFLYEDPKISVYEPSFISGDKAVSGTTRGSAFHKVMELLDFAQMTEPVSIKEAEKYVREQLDRFRDSGQLAKEYYHAVRTDKIAGFLISESARRMRAAAAAGKLFKEQPFVMGLPASVLKDSYPEEEIVLIQGIIDVFWEEEDGFVVLDYKTDAVQHADELVQRYSVQLDYYARALEQMTGYRDKISGKERKDCGKRVKEKVIYSFKLAEEINLLQ